jgi:hypothetical protein
VALGMDARATFLAVVKGDVSDAVSSFNKLSGSVDKSTKGATGAMGKFKNFAKGVGSEVAANMTSMAATAGAAFATLAYQSANALADLAKASGDFSRATGLSIEQSSRWIEVAGDFNVEADTLQTAIGRMNRQLDSPAFAKYGIQARDAGGNLRSTEDILIDVLTTLNATTDAQERARMGQAIFGRGWQQLAPLLGKTDREYRDLLSSVKAGMVITSEEAANAGKWRDANLELADSIENLRYQLGESAAAAAPYIQGIASTLDTLNNKYVKRAIETFRFGTISAAKETYDFIGGLFSGKSLGEALGLEESTKQAESFGEPAIWQRIVSGIDDMNKGVEPLQKNLGYFGQNLGGVNDELSYLMGLLDDEERFLNVLDSFDELQQAAVDYYVAVKDGSGEAEQKERDYKRQVIDTKREVLDYIGEIDNVPTSLVTFISAQLDAGSFAAVEAAIAGLARKEVSFTYFGRITDRVDGERAMGGPVSAAGTYLVGERGPELFVPGTSGSIVPNGSLGGTTILNVTVTNPIASGEQLANELAAYTRRNGSAWLSGAR